jgi:murein DD-endopeptidase MepM/ murein hydrolase activator NlpD
MTPARALGAAIAISVGLALWPPPLGAAPSLTEKRQELERVRERLRLQRDRLEQKRGQERRISTEVRRLDGQRLGTEARLARLSQELRRVRMREEVAAGALARAEMALARRRSLLADRVLDAHRFGRAGYLDVVLGATSFTEFVARTRLVGSILHHDANLIKSFSTDRDRAANLREELAVQQARVRSLVSETEERQETLVQQGLEKRSTLRQIRQERTASEQAVRELEEESAEIETLIQRLQATGMPRRGQLSGFVMPVRGTMTSRFGYRVHPLFGRRHFHAGVDFAAPTGTSVQAAYSGTVLITGWYGGYGRVVVIDHGGGMSTLYGHLSSVLVATGQTVSAGQVIGRVGSTGYSTGPHLHYEVRRDGRPVSPL